MSAIAGLWNFDGRPGARDSCRRMLAAQEIYGPHHGAVWSEGEIAMGRRLFRTLPEDLHDRGRVLSRDGRMALVADVRLDNRDELVSALGLGFGEAAVLADSALLLESLVRWGESALDRIVGDFAFAWWDTQGRRLTLARDFCGQRPLHYHRGNGFFAFASMAKGIHTLPEVPYGPDEQAMAEFLALLPPDENRSFFEGIVLVRPGHVVTVTAGGVQSRRYWNPAPSEWRGGRPADYAEGLRHHLDQAVRARLRGTGARVGTQLSAGYDSSAVTATAARLIAAEGGQVVAFTAVPREGYDGPCPKGRIGDEGPLAAATAAMHPNVEHVLVRSGGGSPLDEIDRTFFLFERPTLNLCNFVWIRGIAAAARERSLSVMLTGQLGNVGLSYSGMEFLPELVRRGRLLRLAREGEKLIAKGDITWRYVLSQSFGPFVPAALWRRLNRMYGREFDIRHYTALRADRMAEMGLPALAAARGLDPNYRPRRSALDARLWILSRTDLGTHNKGLLAGWGIDQRDPTADRRLIEYCLALPMEAYVSNGSLRAVARAALADRVPAAVLDERRKGYQAVDWHEGFAAARVGLAEELRRLESCGPAAGTIDLQRLRSLLDAWPEKSRGDQDATATYRIALLRGVSAGHFLRRSSGANT